MLFPWLVPLSCSPPASSLWELEGLVRHGEGQHTLSRQALFGTSLLPAAEQFRAVLRHPKSRLECGIFLGVL